MSPILGSYWASTNNIDELTKQFNIRFANKLFIKISEIGSQGGFKSAQQLKSFITDRWQRYEKKFQDTIQMKSFARFIFHTNFDDALNVEKYDRRFICIALSDAKRGDTQYFEKLAKTVQDPEALRHFFTYLKRDFDMSDVNLREIPMTEWRQSLIEVNLPTFDRYWTEVCNHAINVKSYTFLSTLHVKYRSQMFDYYEHPTKKKKEVPEIFNIPAEIVYDNFTSWCLNHHRWDTVQWNQERFYKKMKEVLGMKRELKWTQVRFPNGERYRCIPLPKPSSFKSKIMS